MSSPPFSSIEKGHKGEKHNIIEPQYVPNNVSGDLNILQTARCGTLCAAITEGTTDPRSKPAIVIYICAATAFMCNYSSGYDGSLMAAINGMPFYQQQFNQGKLSASTGIIFSIFTVGNIAGTLFAGLLCDRFGRRAGMFAGCIIVIVGSAIISCSTSQAQFIGGRFVLGMGTSIANIGAPIYIVEISPPQWRGRLTSLYGTGWNGGAIIAAAITLATSRIQSEWSWRIPLILQAVPATIVVLIVWLLPESPRWLCANGRNEEAVAFIKKYHANNDPNHPLLKLQIEEFEGNIRKDGSDKRWWDFKALIATREARWRMLMVVLIGIFSMMSGGGLGYYNLSIYQALGFDKQMQYNMNLIGACMYSIASWVAVSLADKMSRRSVLVIGTFFCACTLGANAAFSAKWASYGDGPKDLIVARAAAAFFFLFGIVFSFTYTPLISLYLNECLETTTRAKGGSVGVFIIYGITLVNLFVIPIAFDRIGWKYILPFVAWDLLETIIWYFLCVETAGRTLEELHEIFCAPNPVKASIEKKKLGIARTGAVMKVQD
ncbi:general substrate transporter [Rickenella mellea]|uniref:General substrate transporter n=1 Tax=Rickenella mellea TaxID=50990 RepID=A0A4Y7Q0E1_9AGAM|nr:general substrate transporter [Rickenella mellea]